MVHNNKEDIPMDGGKISVPFTIEEQARIRDIIPWGMRQKVMRQLILMAVKSVEDRGEIMLGALLSGEVAITLATAGQNLTGTENE